MTEKLRLLGPPLARGRPFKWLHYVTEPRGSRRCLLRLYDGLEEGRGSWSRMRNIYAIRRRSSSWRHIGLVTTLVCLRLGPTGVTGQSRTIQDNEIILARSPKEEYV